MAASIHGKPQSQAEIAARYAVLRKQGAALISQLGRYDRWPKVPCGDCGKEVSLRFAYNCFYCGIYFCRNCAPKHFGGERPLIFDPDKEK